MDHSGFEPETDRLWVDCSNLWANGPGSCDRVWTYNQSDMNRTLYQLSYTAKNGGVKENRTLDLMLAKHALYQLSYNPFFFWSGWQDLNPWPSAPKADAIPNYATSRNYFGALDRNWTHNLLVRSQILYPIELLALFGASYWIWTNDHCFANNCLTTWLRMH